MPRINIEDIVEQRLDIIQTETPGVVTRYEIEEDEDSEWGVITICEEDGRSICVEFIESFESLSRRDILDQYNEAAVASGRVLVIVPDRLHERAADMLLAGSNPAIELISYGVIGITLLA